MSDRGIDLVHEAAYAYQKRTATSPVAPEVSSMISAAHQQHAHVRRQKQRTHCRLKVQGSNRQGPQTGCDRAGPAAAEPKPCSDKFEGKGVGCFLLDCAQKDSRTTNSASSGTQGPEEPVASRRGQVGRYDPETSLKEKAQQ